MPDQPLTHGESDRLAEQAELRTAEQATASAAHWQAHAVQHAAHAETHEQEHRHESELTRLREQSLAEAFARHQQVALGNAEAVRLALGNVDRLAEVHQEAHGREHLAHETRHEDARLAVSKADTAMDRRLDAIGLRLDELRDGQANLARVDAEAKARTLGQGHVVAIMMGGLLASTLVIGLIAAIANAVGN